MLCHLNQMLILSNIVLYVLDHRVNRYANTKKVDLSRLFLHFFFFLLSVMQGRTSVHSFFILLSVMQGRSASTCMKFNECLASREDYQYVCQSLHSWSLIVENAGDRRASTGCRWSKSWSPSSCSRECSISWSRIRTGMLRASG